MALNNPATPLPWRLFESGHLRTGLTLEVSPPSPARLGERPAVVAWPGFDGSDMPAKDQLGNARYLVHAANAYPKLVAALYEMTRAERAKPPSAMTVREQSAFVAAERLLTELGEAR